MKAICNEREMDSLSFERCETLTCSKVNVSETIIVLISTALEEYDGYKAINVTIHDMK